MLSFETYKIRDRQIYIIILAEAGLKRNISKEGKTPFEEKENNR